MRIWVDCANSPHVPFFRPVVEHLETEGHDVVVSVRDHAQTLQLAEAAWPAVEVIGGSSPGGRVGKARGIAVRAAELRRLARRERVDVALSHGSYAQLLAARLARIPAVTIMDYEHQPANHLSFRLAHRIVVPDAFPASALRRCGARRSRVLRYPGFKEQLYLGGPVDASAARAALGIGPDALLAVLRPPPEGALYHRGGNDRFEAVLAFLEAEASVEIVLLPRSPEQRDRYLRRRVLVPERPVDGAALLAAADLVVGAGGTMTREAALLGTPTYTVFTAELAAVDAELIRRGLVVDLRDRGLPRLVRRDRPAATGDRAAAERILRTIVEALDAVVR